jgi:hypothetical protein
MSPINNTHFHDHSLISEQLCAKSTEFLFLSKLELGQMTIFLENCAFMPLVNVETTCDGPEIQHHHQQIHATT